MKGHVDEGAQVDTIVCHFKNREWFWGKVYGNIVLTAFEEGRLSE